MCGTHSRALCAGGTAKGIAREARVPRRSGFATAEAVARCRGGCAERAVPEAGISHDAWRRIAEERQAVCGVARRAG